jgi:hypothetical protein
MNKTMGGPKWKKYNMFVQSVAAGNMNRINFRQQEEISQKYLMYRIRSLLLSAARDVGIRNCIKISLLLDGIF